MRWVLAFCGAASLAGCSAPDTSSPPPTTPFCASDPRVTAFSLNLEARSTSGALRVRIVEASPSRVIQGTNDWTLSLSDGAGAALDGLTLAVKPAMPDHGHGSSTIPQIAALGSGRYRVTGISMPMRGVWNVSVNVTGSVNDSATYTFCVDGT